MVMNSTMVMLEWTVCPRSSRWRNVLNEVGQTVDSLLDWAFSYVAE